MGVGSRTVQELLGRIHMKSKENNKKILLLSMKGVLFLGFLYVWKDWTGLLNSFRESHDLYLTDYLISLPFCIGLFLALIPFRIYIMAPSLLLLLGTTYLYFSTLFFGQAWKSATIGLIFNSSAIFLFLYNWNKSRNKINDKKNKKLN
ncbi:hypothetical protein DID77_03320 [Candidatus Marinamargulisbacteria bacterium SCGC AG-439-L15]|nr:hypothetical protein DID77_03320 [Candidatus Marinamargulisbacteria bacterium SCGC AG-439-L15]